MALIVAYDCHDKKAHLTNERYLGVHISGFITAIKKADSKKDIWCPYCCPRDINEKIRFEVKYDTFGVRNNSGLATAI